MNLSGIIHSQRNLIRNKRVQLSEIDKKASKKSSRDPNASKIGKITPKIGGTSGQFEESVVNLTTIYNAYSSDSYLRRAIDNVSTLMLKSGYELKGKNKEALNYVKTRLKLIEEATGLSFDELITELCDNYVLYSNAPVVKVRNKEDSAGLNLTGYYGGDPIAGYFPINPQFFQVKRDDFGEIEAYKATSDGSEEIELAIEDVMHLSYRKPTGSSYGIPYFQNVLDDILILRNIEENVSQLIYRNLFPLTVYTVGNIKDGFQATDEEIDDVINRLGEMRLDEIHVLPERHKIETINNGNAVMDVSSYLAYFRQRVFTGLGMSETVMGVSGTANKSTSDNQNSDLNDLVKDFQRRFQAQIQRGIIDELLFEGGYDPVLNLEDSVSFVFTEIEQSAKIARENHAINKFNNNAISIDELREDLGLEPTEDFSRFHFILHDKTGVSLDSAKNTVDNLNQPENQHGKQDNPTKKQTKDKVFSKKGLTEKNERVRFSLLEEKQGKNNEWETMKKQFFKNKNKGFLDKTNLSVVFETYEQKTAIQLDQKIAQTFQFFSEEECPKEERFAIKEHIHLVTKKANEELQKRFYLQLTLQEEETSMDYLEAIFLSMEKRVEALVTYQELYLNQVATAVSLFSADETVRIQKDANDCKKCLIDTLTRESDWFKQIPPYHQGCRCQIQTKN